MARVISHVGFHPSEARGAGVGLPELFARDAGNFLWTSSTSSRYTKNVTADMLNRSHGSTTIISTMLLRVEPVCEPIKLAFRCTMGMLFTFRHSRRRAYVAGVIRSGWHRAVAVSPTITGYGSTRASRFRFRSNRTGSHTASLLWIVLSWVVLMFKYLD